MSEYYNPSSANLARVDAEIHDQQARNAAKRTPQSGAAERHIEVRRGGGYADALRRYRVIIDGSEVGLLKSGETKRFPVSGDEHEVRVAIDWTGSERVVIPPGENDEVLCVSHAGMISLWGMLRGEGYLSLKSI